MKAVNYCSYVNVPSGSIFDCVLESCGQEKVYVGEHSTRYQIDSLMEKMVAVDQDTSDLLAIFLEENDCMLFCIEYNKKYN